MNAVIYPFIYHRQKLRKTLGDEVAEARAAAAFG